MIEEALLKSNYIGKDGFSWWIGQVAHSKYWKKEADYFNGDWNYRCKVRIVGYHPFSGSILSDDDLPWAQVIIDPAFGSGQGGTGKTLDLKGGETCFGFFLDGDDAQQPVVLGLLHRSDGVRNLISEENVKADMSSGFKPFTGHPGGKIQSTQREVRKNKEIDQTNPTASTTQETSPIPISFADATKLDFGLDTSGVPKNSVSWDSTKGFTSNINAFDPQLNLFGDKLVSQSQSTYGIEKKCDKTYVGANGCQNNLIGQITQGLQDFIAFTNGLDKYLHTYIDPVLNEIVDIKQSIANCARQIGGIIKLIINNLRNTIFKCIVWAFRKLVGLVVPPPQQTIVLEVMKKILDIIFCLLEKLNFLPFIENLLGDLAANTINSPVCAVEQWTAGILANVMDSIENALSTIMSGISWLTDGLKTISGILNQASSLASQIFSFLECTGLACKTPSVWASKFGPSEKEADDWEKMVGNVNVFKGVSKGLGSIEDAMYETPLYGGITGRFNNIFNKCNNKVQNPTSQYDIVPLPVGSKYSICIPPIVNIFGDGVGARAIPIVGKTGSIFSVEVISGGVGYTIEPTITIVDNSGHGTGAYAKAIITNGSVSSIYLTDIGSGYCAGNYTIVGAGGIGGIGNTAGPGIGNTAGPGIGNTAGPGIGTTGGNGTGGNGTGITTSINLTSSKYSINEGDSFVINTNSKNIPDNTLIKYEITGISNKAIKQSLTGNLTIKDNKSSITVDTLKDIIDNSKILKFSLPEYNKSVEIFVNKLNKPQTGKQQYYLTSSKSVITEGQSFIVNLITQNVENNTLVPYTITGISGGLIKNQSLTGTFTVLNNQSKLNIDTNKDILKQSEIFKLTLDNKSSFVSVLIKPINNPNQPETPGISSDVSGCIQDIIVIAPGYGYTTGDRITDGKNTYTPIVSPGSGSIVGIQPLTNPICGFSTTPTLTINTRTGVAADVVPIMKFRPTYNTTNQVNQANQTNQTNQTAAISGIVTSVVDCV
jgi:hypothetical protein